jgi:DUF4097 and DUF4098 domain-containing protein YvlB
MRPYCFLLASLLAMACAPQVARANTPCPDDRDDDEHEHAHSSSHAHAHAWASATANTTGTLDEMRDAKPNGEIDVHAFAGTVHVTGWAQNQVKVHATVNGDCHVEITPSGDRSSVRVECSHGPGNAELEIQVPQASTLEVRTMSAGIGVTGVNGPLRLQSVTADIEVKGGAPSEVEARTTSGNVHIDAASPQIRAQSVSGDVRITGAKGKASVHTVSGDCVLSGGDFSDVRFESVSGDATFTGGVVGSLEAQSHSGNVTLHLPPATNADVELRTFSGELLVDMGNGSPKKATDHELDAKLGVGGARVRVRTFSGDVKVIR